MIKPERLRKGDKVAIVSLSSGLLGEKGMLHKYELGKKRLEEKFGLEVVTMPNALKGIEYLREHPEKRAEDLMAAFRDKSIKAIICAIGGEETIRILPYIDYDVIRNNPKIFSGFSDTTANHLMLYKAGLVSYYGPCVLCDFAEYVDMYDYDAFPIYVGTEIWPSLEEWKDKIIFLETSEEMPKPDFIYYYLLNLGAQGIFNVAKGIIVGKPKEEKYYEEYKEVYRKVLKEFGREDMPVLYNVNFGHSSTIGIIPYGIECELDVDNKTITLLEKIVE